MSQADLIVSRAGAQTLAEIATLAALPKAPSYYSPWGVHTDELGQRKNYVLEQMFKLGFIDEEERTRAQNTEIFFSEPNIGLIKAPHFVMLVRDYLANKYGEDLVEKGGLRVTTTLDWPLQEKAQEAIEEGARRNAELYKGHNAALVAQDSTTGQILAIVGSKNYSDPPEPEGCKPGKTCQFEGNFNVAVQGLRQPGSAFKPFAYLTAFQKGYSSQTIVFDLPTEFSTRKDICPLTNINFLDDNPLCFHPENYDHQFRGPVNFRNALAQSINVPSVKILYLAGLNDTIKNAQSLGINTLSDPNQYGLSLVLGGGEVKLIEMVDAYSVFSREGIKNKQSFILRVEDSQKKTIEEYTKQSIKIIEPQYAKLINNILSDTEARSPLYQNSLQLTTLPDREVAIKTGTTNNYRDAWTIGYTPSLVVGVWAGNNDNTPMQRQAGSILAALPIWHQFISRAVTDYPVEFFNKPDPVFVNKPILGGEYVINNAVHSILYYIKKGNPLDPDSVASPEDDAQFLNWETPVRVWWENLSQNQSIIQPTNH